MHALAQSVQVLTVIITTDKVIVHVLLLELKSTFVQQVQRGLWRSGNLITYVPTTRSLPASWRARFGTWTTGRQARS